MLLVFWIGCFGLMSVVHAESLGCSKTARAFRSYRLIAHDIPEEDISGEHLQVCSAARTCCTERMELQLSGLAKTQLDSALGEQVQKVADQLGQQGNSFDAFFRRLMNESRVSLDEMFTNTYGVLYEQNAQVFIDLFAQLEAYYNTGARDLADVMHEFFTILYKRMFTVLNSQHTFDEKYLQCVATHMEGLMPFRDVPSKLTQQLKRSFVATRTLVQALRTGHQVVKRLQTVSVIPSCDDALMRMSQCSTCHGMPRLKACHGFCLNVIKGCLAHHSLLHEHWQQYIDGITNLVSRLEGPFNIESVVSPINVKISYAIMNFQDNGYDVSRKIFEGCGDPKFRRRRRRRQAGGDGGATYDSTNYRPVQFHYSDPVDEAPSPLMRVLGDIRAQVRPLKTFWHDLPTALCNNREMAAPPARIMQCWNGTAKYRYERPLTKDGMAEQASNPEVPVDPLYTNSHVNEAILDLKRAAVRLREAYNGQTVTWDEPAAASPGAAFSDPLAGSGSGDGSDYDVDAERDDEDDYDLGDYGSGQAPPEFAPPPRGGATDANADIGIPADDDDDENERENRIEFAPPDETNRVPDSGRPSSGSAPPPRHSMSLARAVTVLVCPTLVAWIGTFI